MQRSLMLMCLGLALGVAPALGQDRPDFSGVWEMDMERSETPRLVPDPEPVTILIVQSDTHLVKEIRRGGTAQVLTYLLSGSATSLEGTAETRTSWEGSDLVARIDWRIAETAVTTLERHRLLESGELEIDSSIAVQHGYSTAQSYSEPSTDRFVKVE